MAIELVGGGDHAVDVADLPPQADRTAAAWLVTSSSSPWSRVIDSQRLAWPIASSASPASQAACAARDSRWVSLHDSVSPSSASCKAW